MLWTGANSRQGFYPHESLFKSVGETIIVHVASAYLPSVLHPHGTSPALTAAKLWTATYQPLSRYACSHQRSILKQIAEASFTHGETDRSPFIILCYCTYVPVQNSHSSFAWPRRLSIGNREPGGIGSISSLCARARISKAYLLSQKKRTKGLSRGQILKTMN